LEVDSFRFLPRSFAPLYANATPLDDERDPVWTPFETRLADARIGMISSAGLHVHGTQEPFDAEREKQEPTWGDPTWRMIPSTVQTGDCGMTHLHVNPADILEDHNVALPTEVLDELISDGVVRAQTPHHAAVMGYQEAGLDVWRRETAPAIAAQMRDEGADGVVLAPV
jgi:D-proline reductase (dithiol) PrdB